MKDDALATRLITLKRIAQAGGRNFLRNAWLSAASTAVMAVALTVMLTSLILNYGLNDALNEITRKIDITIFFKDVVSDAQIESMTNELKGIDNVISVHYVDKTEALHRYREQNKDNPELLEAITEVENPLPTSLEVAVKDLNNIQPILDLSRRDEYKEAVDPDKSFQEDRQKTVQRIGNIKRFILQAGVLASLVFATIAVLIIFNTVRMAIFSRREEVEIMRLIGSTNAYIRGPFVFEAILDGALAAIFAIVVGYLVVFVGGPKLISFIDLSDTLAFFQARWVIVGLLTLLSGVLIGVTSSVLAITRYLKL